MQMIVYHYKTYRATQASAFNYHTRTPLPSTPWCASPSLSADIFHHQHISVGDQKVTIAVEYQTSSGSSATRNSTFRQVIATSLPVAVNVEDFFRGTRYDMKGLQIYYQTLSRKPRLFSKYTISTTSHQHIRIASVALEGPSSGLPGVTITGCVSPKRGVVVSRVTLSED